MRGLHVGDRQLFGGHRCTVGNDDVIKLFPYTLSIELANHDAESPSACRRLDKQMTAFVQAVHVELLNRMGRAADTEWCFPRVKRTSSRWNG